MRTRISPPSVALGALVTLGLFIVTGQAPPSSTTTSGTPLRGIAGGDLPALEASSVTIRDSKGIERAFLGLGRSGPGDVSLELSGPEGPDGPVRIRAAIVGGDVVFELVHGLRQPGVFVTVSEDDARIDLASKDGPRVRVGTQRSTGLISVQRGEPYVGEDGLVRGETLETIFHVP